MREQVLRRRRQEPALRRGQRRTSQRLGGRDAGSAPIPLEPPLARAYALAFCAVRAFVGARVLVISKRTRRLEEGRPASFAKRASRVREAASRARASASSRS